MPAQEPGKIRNVAVVGHRGTGKTSLVEALLFQSGETNRLGAIEQGSTVSDWDDDERKRQMSISSALCHATWHERKLNLIDVPGDPSFQGEARAALRVVEGALVAVSGVMGVEVGGAAKNVIAVAAGVSDGLGFGHNTRAALMTRGLAEITRLAVGLGAEPATLYGLSGMGDLVLTCTGDLSRNRSVGLRLGNGEKLEDIVKSMNEVAEGVRNTRSVRDLARSVGVEAPIVDQMYLLLNEGKAPHQAVADLMSRALKRETD